LQSAGHVIELFKVSCQPGDALALLVQKLSGKKTAVAPPTETAEGQPAETFVDRNSRDAFDNADDYALLYPSELPTIVPLASTTRDALVNTYGRCSRSRSADRSSSTRSGR